MGAKFCKVFCEITFVILEAQKSRKTKIVQEEKSHKARSSAKHKRLHLCQIIKPSND